MAYELQIAYCPHSKCIVQLFRCALAVSGLEGVSGSGSSGSCCKTSLSSHRYWVADRETKHQVQCKPYALYYLYCRFDQVCTCSVGLQLCHALSTLHVHCMAYSVKGTYTLMHMHVSIYAHIYLWMSLRCKYSTSARTHAHAASKYV